MKEKEHASEQGKKVHASDGEVYDWQHRTFSYVVDYLGESYDLRETNRDNGNGIYRMTDEMRITRKEPSYIEVDKEGCVVREWN